MNGPPDTGAVLPEPSKDPPTMMVEADSFDVRRNAYFWSWQHQQRVCCHGEERGTAVWCATNYLARLLQRISARKMSVDRARQEMMRRGTSESVERSISFPAGEDGTSDTRVSVELTYAVSGVVIERFTMSRFALLGDAIDKANTDMRMWLRRRARELGTAAVMFAALDDKFTHVRFCELKLSSDESVQVKVVVVEKTREAGV